VKREERGNTEAPRAQSFTEWHSHNKKGGPAVKQVARRVSEGMLGVIFRKTAGALCKTFWHRDQKVKDAAIRAFPRLRAYASGYLLIPSDYARPATQRFRLVNNA